MSVKWRLLELRRFALQDAQVNSIGIRARWGRPLGAGQKLLEDSSQAPRK